ncbi:toll-like receptor 6 isoform X3 [Notamacropus eugenii]|uniref:toll-like receptor 6 isoform X3 n=1 Tax=Notamacropus eugenii TaxID=9315 RepID=UPI003B684C05
MKKEMLRIMQETEYVSVFHAGCISLFLGLSRIHSSTTRTVSILGSTITPQPLHLWFPDQEKLLISSSSTQTGRIWLFILKSVTIVCYLSIAHLLPTQNPPLSAIS